MKRNTIIVIMILAIGFVAITPSVDASTISDLTMALQVFVDSQTELIYQNDRLIEQNDTIIELMKGNRNIFVPGLTDRYDMLEFIGTGQCVVYDRLEREIQKGTCPVSNLTKSQFNSLVTGQPEN